MDNRISKTNYYLDIAQTVSSRSTCLKKHWGAVIVKNNTIISTGYNGAIRDGESCLDCGICNRANSVRGTDYSSCFAVHAEMNCIIHASREQMVDGIMYLVGLEEDGQYVNNPEPCSICKKLIINSGIKEVIVRIDKDTSKKFDVQEWIQNKNKLIGGY